MSGTASEAKPAPPSASRRNLFRTALDGAFAAGIAGLALAAGLWTTATCRFFVPNVHNRPARRFRAGSVRDYPAGCVETRFKDAHGVWLVHDADRGRNRIYALRAACTHLGCITFWDSGRQRFQCPCHGSAFRSDGVNLEGPAPRPLERVAIRLTDDGQLEVDLDRTFREELGQWSDPASYVAVG